jgi:hypothetical protein
VALDPKGTEIVRWALARPAPRFPVWTGTRIDTRIAYLSGGRVRVVAGDGTGDHVLAPAALVAPAWRPGLERVLAYATGRSVVVRETETRRVLLRLPVRATGLAWSGDGRLLLVSTRRGLRAYDQQGRLVLRRSVSQTAAAPGTQRLAGTRRHGSQSDLVQVGSGRLLFRGTGVFGQVAWSPNGRWLLVTWPTADQWVFVRATPRKIVGASRITEQFGGDPRVAGWCCAR